jgi:CBS domain-containing protein
MRPADNPVAEFAPDLVKTTTANTSVVNAANAMLGRDVHHLPVANPNKGVVGIVTSTDLTAYLSGR